MSDNKKNILFGVVVVVAVVLFFLLAWNFDFFGVFEKTPAAPLISEPASSRKPKSPVAPDGEQSGKDLVVPSDTQTAGQISVEPEQPKEQMPAVSPAESASPPAAGENPAPSVPAPATVPAPASPDQSGTAPTGQRNLENWIAGKAYLALLRQQAEVKELELRIKKANDALVAPSEPAALAALHLPDLKMSESSSAPAGPYVVSIQGVDGKLSASIRTNKGIVIVHAGQSFNGGIISSIGQEGVVVRQGKTVRTLPFD